MSRPTDANRSETILRIVALLVILLLVIIKVLPLVIKGRPPEEIMPLINIIREAVDHDALIGIIGVFLLWMVRNAKQPPPRD